ncbi:hypothetical protein BGZ88_003224 [Linnemannia elongata]|nr:hypothetical protein BGZ88_003224 [Linnemannia elongata]
MADHAELIANFVTVSGAIPEQAQFYFVANSWDIDAVTSRFYEEPQAGGAGSGGRDNRGASRVAEDDVLAHSTPKPASKKKIKVSVHF